MSEAERPALYGEDYRRFVETQRSADQTAIEVEYLRAVLTEEAPGRRVVDLGCGVGQHAIELARDGFEVTGLDASAWAIGEAKCRGAMRGIDVRWERVDLLNDDIWPVTEFDAAICHDLFGWGSDVDQRRFLRRIRNHLAGNGILILVHPDIAWMIRHSTDGVCTTVGDSTFQMQQAYDARDSRTRSHLVVSSPEGTRSLDWNTRLYSTNELATLLRQAGFVVDRFDGDFSAHRYPGAAPRSIQAIAHPVATPPGSLAVASWRTPAGDALDLRYVPEETCWLEPSLDHLWEAVLDGERGRGTEAIAHYAVDDPYGGERAAELVSAYFDCPIADHQLTFGPGVTALLRDLGELADGGLIVAPWLTHPDLTAWAVGRGNDVHMVDEPVTLDRLLTEIAMRRPSLVHLDRPDFAGQLMTLAELRTLSEVAARVKAVVVVDESPASYLGPSRSAVPLIHECDNLVILRSVTKAYSCGGLRVGFAVASEGVSADVRRLVPPLQISELAFQTFLRLLMAGDLFQRLRARIRETKPIMIRLLAERGLEVIAGHHELPWVLVPDPGGETSRLLDHHGIRGLRFVPSPAVRGSVPEFLHLATPLSDERLERFRHRLTGPQVVQRTVLASPEMTAPSASWQSDQITTRTTEDAHDF